MAYMKGWFSPATDGVGVGVVIRIVELMIFSESSVPIPLTTPSLTFRLWSSENQIVRVASRRRRTKPISKHGNVHCDWLILPLLLPTILFPVDHKRNVSDWVVNGLILLTPIPSRFWLSLRLPLFDFHWVISALTIPTLVKTSLNEAENVACCPFKCSIKAGFH